MFIIQLLIVPLMTGLYLTSTKQMLSNHSQQIKKFTRLVIIHRTFIMFITFFGRFFLKLPTRLILRYFVVNITSNLIGILFPILYLLMLHRAHYEYFIYHLDFIVIISIGIVLSIYFNIVYYIQPKLLATML